MTIVHKAIAVLRDHAWWISSLAWLLTILIFFMRESFIASLKEDTDEILSAQNTAAMQSHFTQLEGLFRSISDHLELRKAGNNWQLIHSLDLTQFNMAYNGMAEEVTLAKGIADRIPPEKANAIGGYDLLIDDLNAAHGRLAVEQQQLRAWTDDDTLSSQQAYISMEFRMEIDLQSYANSVTSAANAYRAEMIKREHYYNLILYILVVISSTISFLAKALGVKAPELL